MKTDNGRSTSVWMDIRDDMLRPPLAENAEADVCIVGAGIAGMSAAYELSKVGKRVIVLDDGPIAGGETCRTTAHLSNAFDDRFTELERLFGEEWSRLTAESHTAAIDRMETIAAEERIDCQFRRVPGYLFAGAGTSRAHLEEECAAAKRAGLDATLLDETPLPSPAGVPCVRFADQGQFHPTLYLEGLARAIERTGGRIHCGSHVQDVTGGADAFVTTADDRVVRARHIVVATNSPVNDRFSMHTKQAPYRTYVVALEIPKDSVRPALFWDDEDPYHYVRILEEDDRDLLIVGGEDHKTGQADDAQDRYARLETWARGRFPMAMSIAERWSGQVYEPVDYLGFIGRNPGGDDNVFIVTGDSGNGMTHGAIAGMLIRDLILGTKNPWEELYDPSRKTPKAAMEFLKENANVMREYCELVTGGDVASADEVAPDSGAVIRKGVKKIALYRDPAGALHAYSAVCPHLGCIVRWNSEEKTWDCPCHGSRFQKTGAVVNGPAPSGLAREEA